MDSSNNPLEPTGLPYLWSYGGALRIIEELLNLTIIVFMAVSGFSLKAYVFCGIAVIAAIESAVFTILHIRGVTRKSKLEWHWIECVAVLTTALVIAIFSSVVMAVFTRGYIITAVMGYLTSMVYFFDTFHKYQIAITPVPKYAWTMPNMPDLE